LLELYTAKSVLTMNMVAQLHFTIDELVGSHVDLDVGSTDVVEHVERIAGGVLQAGVAWRSGNANEVDSVTVCSIYDS
jgi:hypothetical protein